MRWVAIPKTVINDSPQGMITWGALDEVNVPKLLLGIWEGPMGLKGGIKQQMGTFPIRIWAYG